MKTSGSRIVKEGFGGAAPAPVLSANDAATTNAGATRISYQFIFYSLFFIFAGVRLCRNSSACELCPPELMRSS